MCLPNALHGSQPYGPAAMSEPATRHMSSLASTCLPASLPSRCAGMPHKHRSTHHLLEEHAFDMPLHTCRQGDPPALSRRRKAGKVGGELKGGVRGTAALTLLQIASCCRCPRPPQAHHSQQSAQCGPLDPPGWAWSYSTIRWWARPANTLVSHVNTCSDTRRQAGKRGCR